MTVQQVRLHHFKAREFDQRDLGGENWYQVMSPDLLIRLDVHRGFWGEPININRVLGAIGRRDESESQHNVKRWGEVRAVDVNTELPRGVESVSKFIDYAKRAGFTGCGFYPDWHSAGFHLDVRAKKGFATWGYIGRGKDLRQVSLEVALEYYRNKLNRA